MVDLADGCLKPIKTGTLEPFSPNKNAHGRIKTMGEFPWNVFPKLSGTSWTNPIPPWRSTRLVRHTFMSRILMFRTFLFLTGVSYHHGQFGKRRNLVEAESYYRQADARGSTEAKLALIELLTDKSSTTNKS